MSKIQEIQGRLDRVTKGPWDAQPGKWLRGDTEKANDEFIAHAPEDMRHLLTLAKAAGELANGVTSDHPNHTSAPEGYETIYCKLCNLAEAYRKAEEGE